MSIFGLTLILASTLMHAYVFWRLASTPAVRRRFSGWSVAGAGLVLWTSVLVARYAGHGNTGALAGAVETLGMNWLAVLFLLMVPLLAMDLITGFGFLLPKRAPALRGWALAAGGLMAVIALVQGMRPPVVVEYEVRLAGLPPELDGTVVAALSDLHVGTQRGEAWLTARIEEVQALKPDLVVLLGDIFEGHGAPDEDLFRIMGRLDPPLGKWAVLGNHEARNGEDVSRGLVQSAGFRVLRDEWAEIRPGLVVAGVNDLTSNHRAGIVGDSMAKALANRPPGAAILLSHTPWQAEEAVRAGAGLMLSGHTHGGQVWPFGYLVGLRYPLLGGRYEVDGMPVIVCRGTGAWGPRMRLWRPSEIMRITLRAPK